MNVQAHVETLRDRLRRCPVTRDRLAALTDGALSPSWLSKFAAGRMTNPRVDSLIALDAALRQCEEQDAA